MCRIDWKETENHRCPCPFLSSTFESGMLSEKDASNCHVGVVTLISDSHLLGQRDKYAAVLDTAILQLQTLTR